MPGRIVWTKFENLQVFPDQRRGVKASPIDSLRIDPTLTWMMTPASRSRRFRLSALVRLGCAWDSRTSSLYQTTADDPAGICGKAMAAHCKLRGALGCCETTDWVGHRRFGPQRFGTTGRMPGDDVLDPGKFSFDFERLSR